MSKNFAEYAGFNLSQINKEVQAQWEKNHIFEKSMTEREGCPSFVFYEGPPSANGMPGIHHVMARSIKDVFCRFKTMKGYQVKRKAGWDTHGLPVELGVEKALGMMHKLHEANIKSQFRFGTWERSLEFVEKIRNKGRADFADFQNLLSMMEALYKLSKSDGIEERLCHCDCYDPNFLIDENDKMYLIDWEYSGNDDPATDLGTFICCSDYTEDEALEIIKKYIGHEPSTVELRHHYAYVALAAYYWYVWAIYQTSVGNNVGEYLYLWYRMAKNYCKKAMPMYLEES